jgi:hypothetical protein
MPSLVPTSVAEAKELATVLAQSTLIPTDLQKNPANVLVVIMQGMEVGFTPAQALRSITVIKGKVSIGADGLAALCLSRPDVCAKLELRDWTPERCSYVVQRVGKKEQEYAFTADDAKKAGLLGNQMYDKFRKPMLRARCISLACRAEFPDLCVGLYDADTGELSDGKGGTLAESTPEANDGKTGYHRALELVVAGGKEEAEPKQEVVAPVAERPAPELDAPPPFEAMRARIEAVQSLEELKALVPDIRKFSKQQQGLLKPTYGAKESALADPGSTNP